MNTFFWILLNIGNYFYLNHQMFNYIKKIMYNIVIKV